VAIANLQVSGTDCYELDASYQRQSTKRKCAYKLSVNDDLFLIQQWYQQQQQPPFYGHYTDQLYKHLIAAMKWLRKYVLTKADIHTYIHAHV